VRALALLLALAAPAHADLYRWVDPHSGSVKLSNLPPENPSAAANSLPESRVLVERLRQR
jgi:hypothetical protein